MVRAHADRGVVAAGDHVLQFASPCFDASVFEVFGALMTGATLHLARSEELMPGPELVELMRKRRISTTVMPPAALAVMPHPSLPDLKLVMSAGDVCPEPVWRRWSDGRRFLNGYGPTETTVLATIADCTTGVYPPNIGRPIYNCQIYLLDRHLQLVPVGVVGELYIAGVGLARGI